MAQVISRQARPEVQCGCNSRSWKSSAIPEVFVLVALNPARLGTYLRVAALLIVGAFGISATCDKNCFTSRQRVLGKPNEGDARRR
jgi:hypothetical protein